jgi:hypothetical protein
MVINHHTWWSLDCGSKFQKGIRIEVWEEMLFIIIRANKRGRDAVIV